MTGHDLHNALLVAEVESLRAKLAAAEQERDKAQAQRERYYEAARQFGQAANRAEAALAAVRESATNLFNQIGFAGVQAIAEIAGRALAATEQDEPKRCAHGQSGPHHWNPEGTYSNGPGAGCPGPVEPKPCVHAVCSCTMGALPRCPEPTPEQP